MSKMKLPQAPNNNEVENIIENRVQMSIADMAASAYQSFEIEK